MPDFPINVTHSFRYFICALVFTGFLNSCTIIKKTPAGKPYLVKNNIEVKGGNFTKLERSALKQRLFNQLDDSAKVETSSPIFLVNIIKRPTAFDTGYSHVSALNMMASMVHLGYYNSKAFFHADTSGRKVTVNYTVETGKPTLIDTVSYRLRKPDIQQLVLSLRKESILQKNNPITKAAVQSEIARLVDSLRNKGYYKFTASELHVLGDTSLAILTTITDDPFEQLRLLAEAQQKRDSPTVKIAIALNNPEDSTRLNSYLVRKIYLLPDYRPGDSLGDTTITQRDTRNFILRYHERLFRTGFLGRNIWLRPEDLYKQSSYYKTLTSLSNTGVWETVNIQALEVPDSSLVDLFIEMVPAKKFGFEAALEASYSTTNSSNALAGNLLGISGNFSLTNRNIGKEGIRMTHRLRAGVELNNNSKGSGYKLINSNEVSYSNNVIIPRFPNLVPLLNKEMVSGETFINTSVAYSNRLQLFNLQTINLNLGANAIDKRNRRWTFRPFNLEFNYLFNTTDSFKNILAANPFLRYSYNTSYVVGMGWSLATSYKNPRHLNSQFKARDFKLNMEESGLTWANLGVAKKYLRKYIKTDVEYKYTVDYKKTALAFRLFTGIGIPLGSDTAKLPFFKQYFGGGSNSMRGWPIRGIGPGSQAKAPYSNSLFNDRLGDIQLEGNMEYRYEIARIIPNTLTLRGALFVDAGNVWNFNSSKTDGSRDSAQFKFKNIYKELGVSAGTGFRFDFNYLILRVDLGFRFKRPELADINSGWKAPSIGFDDFFKKVFGRAEENRIWRYENFNFSIGINYPF
ncbi:MAG: BamA/TamA family outer membrane protein [Ferruginibacter sp.]